MITIDQTLSNHLETNIFPVYFNTCRWFAGKARAQKGFKIQNALSIGQAQILIVEALYHDGPSEFYQLPLTQLSADVEIPEKGILEKNESHQIIDAIYDEGFRSELYKNIYNNN